MLLPTFPFLLLLALSAAQQQSCVYNGQEYAYRAFFPADDDCNECSCLSQGYIACTEMECLPKSPPPPPVFSNTDSPSSSGSPASGSPASGSPASGSPASGSPESGSPASPATTGWQGPASTEPSSTASLAAGTGSSTYATGSSGPASEPKFRYGVQCAYGMQLVDPGFTYTEGCSDCICNDDGTISCSQQQACCLYLDEFGDTARVWAGDHYSDGCNQCLCMANADGVSGGGACTRMACPQKCQYKNWDGVFGYSADAQGQYVAVMDEEEEYGCPKFCRCVSRRRGAKITCRTDEGDVEPCVYF